MDNSYERVWKGGGDRGFFFLKRMDGRGCSHPQKRAFLLKNGVAKGVWWLKMIAGWKDTGKRGFSLLKTVDGYTFRKMGSHQVFGAVLVCFSRLGYWFPHCSTI